jgi:hypothetical protein
VPEHVSRASVLDEAPFVGSDGGLDEPEVIASSP